MLEAMQGHFPAEARWTRPEGGLFLWVTLPESIDTAGLLPDALAEKVAFVPGASFFADHSGTNTMRLNFTAESADVIGEGISRLGRVLARAIERAKTTRAEAS